MPVICVCLTCGQSFVSLKVKQRQKYCCRSCWSPGCKDKDMVYYTHKCEGCGKDFTIPREKARFCSVACTKRDWPLQTITAQYESGMSLASIAKEYKVTSGAIAQLLQRNNVVVKEKDHGRHRRCKTRTPLTEDQQAVVVGLLLSDANSRIGKGKRRKGRKKPSQTTSLLEVTSIHEDFLIRLQTLIPINSAIRVHSHAKKAKIKGKICKWSKSYRLRFSADLSLDMREKWYIDKRKIVPRDIVLTPTAVKYWFYGDGSSTYKRYKGVNAYVALTLCTNSFTREDCQFLADELERVSGAKFNVETVRRKKSKMLQHVLYSCRIDAVNAFFDYIGECDVPCFAYKWKRPVGSCTQAAWTTHKSLDHQVAA